ncbi:MAG: EAL domain-containing protein [Gammaproteobacteria bacterium]|nr:EAL domain-containing protein [Gammaproteobacteria bacterium]
MSNDKRPLAFLHIEDDRIEAELVADLLRQTSFAGVRLVQRTRVGLGIEALQNERFDLVLLDLNLPDGDGIDNLHRVRAVDERVPVVIMTNIEDENTALELVAKGAQDYLVKRELSPALVSRTLRYAMARQAADLRLRESERRFALAVAGARDGIWDWDLDAGRTWYSPRWFDMLALDAEAALPIPETWLDRVVDEDRAGLKKALEAHLDGLTPHFEYEFRMIDGYGKPQWVLARGVAVRGADGQATRIAGSLTDITDRKTTEAMLVHEALHDALTGLPNRNLFLDRLDLALRQFKRDRSRKFAVLFLDLDRFKSINDSLGHAAGDALLIEIGRRLGKFVRPGDSVARLGGDEFAILLGDVAGLAEATLVAERLHDLMSQKFIIAGKELYATASIGIALADSKYERSADMLRDADLAMYRTKRRRSGSYAVFDNVMHETALARLELETDLRAAAQRNELAVYYQPIVSLDHMRVVGFEALVRWFHPVRGLLAPDDFIPLAEESGSIGQLTWWVMHEACRQTRAWQLSDPTLAELSISVNVSSRLFSEPDFAARTQAILEDTGLAPAALHLEITENALLEHEAETVRELSALQKLGVKLHLDDFGTGYSSLSYLNLFAYDTLKIDRTFVTGSANGGRDNRIVDALINLGRVLEMNVIAEGVETQEQAQKLRDLNCGMAQGFWFSKPLPSDSAHALLQRELDVARSSIRNLTRH